MTCYELQENEALYSQQLNNNKSNYPNKETITIMKISNNNNIIYVNMKTVQSRLMLTPHDRYIGNNILCDIS